MRPRLLEKFPVAIASMSLGRAAQHDLETKIKACADAGFNGIEVFYEDIKLPARAMTTGTFEENLLKSAATFKELCDRYDVEIMVLQPFKNYDGLLSEKRRTEKLAKLHNWLKIAKILGTEIIQIPSMFHQDPEVATGDPGKIAADLREVADLGAKEDPPVRFAYEIMAWGAHVDVWQTGWEIIQIVSFFFFVSENPPSAS
jgi:4-hydroxyphenylpyruvate dioxygenase